MNGTAQLAMFDLRRLEDVSLDERFAAALRLLETDADLTTDDRRRLLLLVVSPKVYAEVER